MVKKPEFKDQGGAATSDPNPVVRWLQSKIMTHISSEAFQNKKRAAFERQRQKNGDPHVVEYFHQVDDGYSHLAAQLLSRLAARYDIELKCYLVTGPQGDNAPEPDLLLKLARYDSFHVAPEYGLEFPEHPEPLDAVLHQQATAILAAQSSDRFVEIAARVGQALWCGDSDGMAAMAVEFGSVDSTQAKNVVEEGNTQRTKLGHYSGAMFYYGGEWYWGVDRLYHLENRLKQLGIDKDPNKPILVPRPSAVAGALRDNGSLTLEVFPSLRSPYTAISFDRAVALAQQSGVKLSVRPVLPMVMRGVPATRQKGMYIFKDTAREARAAGVSYAKFYDPIGEPVRKAYALYPWACEQGKNVEFISSFLKTAFDDGISTNNTKGLKRVVERAGLSWQDAQSHFGSTAWEDTLEENRQIMYRSGLWGVPSFRLLDEQGQQVLALWGQDRLWLFARAIQRELEKSS